MTTTNATVIRLAYDAYARRDFAAVFSLLHPDVAIHQTSELPWGGDYHGHDGAREFFGKLAAHTEAAPQPEEFVEAGNAVVALGWLRGRARSSGLPIDLRIVHVWTLEERRIVRFDAYIDTPRMLEALGRTEA